MRPQLPTDGIPEDRVATILTRAAEIDRTMRETISVDALRTAALDAGISPAAVDTALEEYAAGLVGAGPAPEPERKPRVGRIRGFFRRAARAMVEPLKLGAIAFGLGLLGGTGEAVFLIGYAGLLFMGWRLARKYRPARRARGFLGSMVVLTLGLVFGFAAGQVDEDVIAALFGLAIPLAIAGTLYIKVRLPKRWRARGEIEAPAA